MSGNASKMASEARKTRTTWKKMGNDHLNRLNKKPKSQGRGQRSAPKVFSKCSNKSPPLEKWVWRKINGTTCLGTEQSNRFFLGQGALEFVRWPSNTEFKPLCSGKMVEPGVKRIFLVRTRGSWVNLMRKNSCRRHVAWFQSQDHDPKHTNKWVLTKIIDVMDRPERLQTQTNRKHVGWNEKRMFITNTGSVIHRKAKCLRMFQFIQ